MQTDLLHQLSSLLAQRRGCVLTVIAHDPREATTVLSRELALHTGLRIHRITSGTSEQELADRFGNHAMHNRLWIIADAEAIGTRALSMVIRGIAESGASLVLGSSSLEVLSGFANKIDAVIDDAIPLPVDSSNEQVGRALELIGSSAVDAMVARCELADWQPSQILKHVLLPQIVMRKILPQPPPTGSDTRVTESSDPAEANGSSIDQLFDSIPLDYRQASSTRANRQLAPSRTSGPAASRKGSHSSRVDRSRVRATRDGRFSLFHTILSAAPHQHVRQSTGGPRLAIRLEPHDIRRYPFKPSARSLTIVIVDSSGSMASSSRIRFAKGLTDDILRRTYRERNEVALIVARGMTAETISLPTRSIARIHAALRTLPTGGATPLPLALERALEVAVGYQRRHGASNIRIVVLTDGKSNVAEGAASLPQLAVAFQRLHIDIEVVDLVRPSETARRFAETLGARYAFYARANTAAHFA